MLCNPALPGASEGLTLLSLIPMRRQLNEGLSVCVWYDWGGVQSAQLLLLHPPDH